MELKEEDKRPKLEIFRDKKETIIIGEKTPLQLNDYLVQNKIEVSPASSRILANPEFASNPNSLEIDVVRLKAREIVGDKFLSTDEIIGKALELGLELCPAEVGVYYRVVFKDQKIGKFGQDSVIIAMDPIAYSDNDKRRFTLYRFSENDYLIDASPSVKEENPLQEFVFRLPNQKP